MSDLGELVSSAIRAAQAIEKLMAVKRTLGPTLALIKEAVELEPELITELSPSLDDIEAFMAKVDEAIRFVDTRLDVQLEQFTP